MQSKLKILLMDANVLIDYQKSDFSVLGLANQYIGEVHVLTPIIAEVEGINVIDCERLGLKVVDPELNQLMRAAKKHGQLSFHDHLCLIVASDGNYACVTNDKPLRKACTDADVSIMWGLEIMAALIRTNAMQVNDAIQTAEKIHLSNPLHIPRSLVDRFAKYISKIEKKQR